MVADVAGLTAVEEEVASLTPATEVAGAMQAVAGVTAAITVAGATAVVHGATEVVLLGTGKAPSHLSPNRPIAPFQLGVFHCLSREGNTQGSHD